MESDDFDRLHDLIDPQLLHILAFRMSEYVPEAREILLFVMNERGFTDAEIREYRKLHLRRQSLDHQCYECGIKLHLEGEDMRSGAFTCPECNTQQLVTYPDSAYYTPSELDVSELPEEVEEEEVQEVIDEEEPAVVEIQPEPDPDIPAGSSGVTCLQCEKELSRDEVFVSDGEFYCELCFGKQDRSSEQVNNDSEETDPMS